MAYVSQEIIYDIRKDLFHHLQKLPFSYYDSRPAGKILVRVINYVNSVSDILSNGIITVSYTHLQHQRNHLHRFSQAHVVGQDAAHMKPVQRFQPVIATLLIGPVSYTHLVPKVREFHEGLFPDARGDAFADLRFTAVADVPLAILEHGGYGGGVGVDVYKRQGMG